MVVGGEVDGLVLVGAWACHGPVAAPVMRRAVEVSRPRRYDPRLPVQESAGVVDGRGHVSLWRLPGPASSWTSGAWPSPATRPPQPQPLRPLPDNGLTQSLRCTRRPLWPACRACFPTWFSLVLWAWVMGLCLERAERPTPRSVGRRMSPIGLSTSFPVGISAGLLSRQQSITVGNVVAATGGLAG